ncbi:rho guanine nucleotide exchange factor 5-like isoform X1 [Mauremys mutica]|uniref:rho guanine nucleotide exchange factor 5-like isoform X1 n=1 Tax=Mauremys mutica TaxID=74926 RepID=UPI001D15B59E|nr:rho guanine nucleotide exchange factor 5-like isoform X1 [Mauremys mutica]XP_044852376.1 rho guanine nucleotide exchange factor 5-like isoform X1 [Mauremys mutica]
MRKVEPAECFHTSSHWDGFLDVLLMESEEANGGDPFPPATSSPSEENPDPTPARRGHDATTESVEMSTELPGSAEGAQISIAQDPLRHLSAGESAEMCGRSSNPVLSGLEQVERDLRHQRGLSEWEKEPAVQERYLEKQRWDHSSNSEQGKLAHPESSQYSSFPNTVPQATATHDKTPQVQSPVLQIEFPQDQKQSLACHIAVPQAQHKETSMTDTIPIQGELATKHFMVCKDISEVHCKTETLHDDTIGDPPLQELDVANGTIRELPPSTEAVAGTDEEPSPGMDVIGRMNPMPSVDNGEKVGGLQGRGEDTDSSSSHHPPYPLSDDSQGKSQLTGGNADGKMVLSSHERGNNALATDQKTEVAAWQSPSGSIILLPEEEKGADDGRAEGSTECPRVCVFHILNAAKNTEQEEWQHEQLECGEEPEEEEQSEEKQPELEQEEPEWEKLEKEAKPVHEEQVRDREDQKEKRWDELEQEPGREESEQEAPPPALNPASPSLSKQNWDLHDEGESISSAEGTGLASLPQESFSKDQHSGEDELFSIVSKACIGGANERAQPPAVIKSESQNPVGGSSMMHSPTCHISEHWGDMGVSDPFSSISFSGQDCEETCQDNRASNGEDGHSDGDGRTVQSFDDRGAISPLCREVTSSGAGNPDSSGTLDPSSGARNLGSFGPADPHPVAENPAFPSHYDFTPASPSEFNSAASAAGQPQEDADERSQASPVGCTDLDKAPVSVQDTSRQTSYLQEAASSEGASVTTSTESVQTPHGLLTPENGLNEDPSAQPSISKAFRSPPSRQSLPTAKDEVESTPAAPATMHLESSQAPNMALAPANYLEKVQRHQKPPTRSFVFQGKEMEANMVHTAQQNPLLDESHLSLEVEVPGTGSALNAVPQPPEEAVVLALEQHTQPTPPEPDSSSPLAPAPDANQLTYPLAPAPDSPLAPVPDADQLTHPPAPAPDSPLATGPDADQLTHPPVPALGSPLATVPDAEQLTHPLAPVPSSPLAPASDADQLTHPPAPAPDSPLATVPDADQLTHPPAPALGSPLATVPDAEQLTHPPAPAPSSPLAPDATQLAHHLALALGSPLAPMPDTNQLTHPPAAVPSSPLAPVSDADQLTHTLVPAPSSPPAPDATQVAHPLAPAPDANQLSHPLAPVPSLTQALVPDADQLTHPPAPAPSSPPVPVYDTTQLIHPLAPVPSLLLAPVPILLLAPVPDADQLAHSPAPVPGSPPALVPDATQLAHSLVPLPSLPLAPAPDATQLTHPLAPAPDADQLACHLAPAPSSPVTPAPDADQLACHLAAAPSSPVTPAPDANQLAHPLAPGSLLVLVPDATQPPASAPGSPLAPLADATQLTHPPAPVPGSPSSPLALLADAYQLLQSQSLVPDSNQPPAPAPDIDQPLPPVSNSNPPLNYVSDSSQLLATAPNSSCPAQAPASVPDADSLAHALVPAPAVADGEENPLLMQMTHEGVSGAQWDPVTSLTLDVVDTSDLGVTSLAESSDFPTLENEAPMGHSGRSPEAMGQHLATHCGKSAPDYTSRPSLGGWGTSTDSQSRNSPQPPPLLAFSNPIHFLQFSPPSPPAIRTLYRQDAVFEEPQWDQAQAGPTSVDTRNRTAPAVIIEKAEGARTCKQKMEGQGEPLHLVAQVKEELARHAPLEKSSSWPDKKVIRVDNSGSQENVIKRRAKSRDWHRQGLRKMSVLPDNLQEEGAHKDQPTSLDTVILREKKSAATLDNFKRRHSKLINSSGLLYQEYSDVALNKAIQSQKRADSLAEDFEVSSPSSPRLRRKVLSQQDSYLQRLSISSNASLWQDIPMIRGSRMLLNMSRDDQKLQEAKFELIMSEASYLRSLNVAVDHFQCSSELQTLLTNQERKWLFSRLQEVRDVSASFLFELEEKFEENMFNFNVCDVALRHAPEFRKVYLPYVTNQTYQEQIFQKLVTGNARFQQVLEKLESATVCQRLSLKSFLILPFQRITRLKLLLQNILKRTPPESDEEVQATQAYDALEKLIKDCNENVQRMKSTEELIYLRQKIDFECKIFPLVSQSRRLVKCGELMALHNTLSTKGKPTTRPIYLHLFNDCLLLSRPREGGRFVVFDHAAFSDVRGEKCEMKLHGPNKNVFRLFLLKNNQGKRVEFLFRTETHSEKLRWISALAPPRGEPDLLESPDSPQVQCIRTYKARENDELALEKADILMVMQNSNDGWMEGVKLSDGERGWFPSEHVEVISSKHARQMNLKEEQRVKNAKQQVFCKK